MWLTTRLVSHSDPTFSAYFSFDEVLFIGLNRPFKRPTFASIELKLSGIACRELTRQSVVIAPGGIPIRKCPISFSPGVSQEIQWQHSSIGPWPQARPGMETGFEI